jgi:hypothetical protein
LHAKTLALAALVGGAATREEARQSSARYSANFNSLVLESVQDKKGSMSLGLVGRMAYFADRRSVVNGLMDRAFSGIFVRTTDARAARGSCDRDRINHPELNAPGRSFVLLHERTAILSW